MKNVILCAMLVFFSLVQAQNTDSLKLALNNARHDTVKCNILNLLAETAPEGEWENYNAQLNTFCEQKLKTLQKKDPYYTFYQKYYASSINNIGVIYNNQSNTAKALECFIKSLSIFEEIGYRKEVAALSLNIGSMYNEQGDFYKALEYYHRSLKIQEETGDKKGIASSLSKIGSIYNFQANIPKALEYYHKSLKIREETGDKRGIAESLHNLASIYSNQGDVNTALEYQTRGLKIQEEVGTKKDIAQILNNLATLYKKQGNVSKALEYHNKSLKIREEIGNKKGIAESLGNIALIYGEQGNIKKSLEYQLESLKIREEIGEKSGAVYSLNNIGEIYHKQGNYPLAIQYFTKALHLGHKVGQPKIIKHVAQNLFLTYKKTGNPKLALENYELYIRMRDSLQNEENTKATLKQQMQYKYEKKAAADSVKVAEERKVVVARLKQEETQRYALYGGIGLVALFGVFMFNRFRVTQKQKDIIEAKEKETLSQKHIIEEKHKEITDSINYAERIQRSFLASEELLNKNLKDYFVLFKPKDIVSGDFYWAAPLSNNNFAMVTADSTGHGVPGAIMSLLNITSLEKAIERNTGPSEILNATRKTIIDRLQKDGSPEGGKDGMDCSLCIFDFKNMKLHVASANNPVWIARTNVVTAGTEGTGPELIEISADKMPVGKHDKQNIPFTQHEIALQKGDMVYTLTDGFPDQFGGEKGKKFMMKKLRELLLKNAHLSTQQQQKQLEEVFLHWTGNLEQVDDVTIIGIRI